MDERRRATLRLTGTVLAVGLAGCGGDDGNEPTSTTEAVTDTLSEEPPGPGATETRGTETATPTGTTTQAETATRTETVTQTATPTETVTQTATATRTETATQTPTETVSGETLAIDNVGVSAWEVVEDETGDVAPTGEENPTMSFAVGTRYAVENRGYGTHPLALRAADDTPLLSQSADGSYEDDADVDWVDKGERLAFTVTDALAADLDYYICTVHASMTGSVETV